MTNTMTYKGYAARIEYDDEDGIFTGRIAGIRDVVGFHADTVEGLREAFHEAVEDYIATTYNQATDKEKNAVGFVMTIYRRRLASSFHALRKISAATSTDRMGSMGVQPVR